MANESTYADVSSLIASIYEAAWLVAREQSAVAPLVANYATDSSTPRVFASYTGGTVDTVAETDDMTSQTFTKGAAGTITPAQYGTQYFLTDQRISSDPQGVRSDASQDLGELLATHVDVNMVGLFSSLTGGTVGSAGGTITWQNMLRANAYLRANKAPFPYFVVLRPEQWYYMSSATDLPDLIPSDSLKEAISDMFYIGGWAGMEFLIDANITSGTAAVAGMFSRDAMAIDIRRAFRLEPQRDASRGGGGWELNATMIYAYGTKRPVFGCQMIGTSV